MIFNLINKNYKTTVKKEFFKNCSKRTTSTIMFFIKMEILIRLVQYLKNSNKSK